MGNIDVKSVPIAVVSPKPAAGKPDQEDDDMDEWCMQITGGDDDDNGRVRYRRSEKGLEFEVEQTRENRRVWKNDAQYVKSDEMQSVRLPARF